MNKETLKENEIKLSQATTDVERKKILYYIAENTSVDDKEELLESRRILIPYTNLLREMQLELRSLIKK